VRTQLQLAGDIDVVAEAVDSVDALDAFWRLDAPPVPHLGQLFNNAG